MLLKDLITMYECGALNIEYTDGYPMANLGGVAITAEQASAICMQLGWTDWLWSPFKIIDKTAKFIKGIKHSITDENVLNFTDVTFHNRSNSHYYGKKFDRIFCTNAKLGTSYCIIYGMPGSNVKYEVYDHEKNTSVAKLTTLRQVGKFLNGER